MSVPDNPFLDESRTSPRRPGFNDSDRSTSPPPQAPTSSFPPTRYPPPPQNPPIVQAPPSPTGSSHSSSPLPSGARSAPLPGNILVGGTSGPNKGAQGRRVQWPAELASHVSIPVVQSPQTLEDQGAREALQAALEQHSRFGGDFRPSFAAAGASSGDIESQPVSEGTTRAPSEISEGDYQEIRSVLVLLARSAHTFPSLPPSLARLRDCVHI